MPETPPATVVVVALSSGLTVEVVVAVVVVTTVATVVDGDVDPGRADVPGTVVAWVDPGARNVASVSVGSEVVETIVDAVLELAAESLANLALIDLLDGAAEASCRAVERYERAIALATDPERRSIFEQNRTAVLEKLPADAPCR